MPAFVNRYLGKHLTISGLPTVSPIFSKKILAISQFVCNLPIDKVWKCATILAVKRIEC